MSNQSRKKLISIVAGILALLLIVPIVVQIITGIAMI
jgi:hypothetical protein